VYLLLKGFSPIIFFIICFFIVFLLKYCMLETMEMVIPLPPKFPDIDHFVWWTIKTPLRKKVPERAINEMGLHKWWIMRDYSRGVNSPETYVMFVNIDVNNPPICELNTAFVCWNPRSFGWGLWERCWRTLKKANYPKQGDLLQVIPLIEGMSFNLRQMVPIASKPEVSRRLWYNMQGIGWTLVAQGETLPHKP